MKAHGVDYCTTARSTAASTRGAPRPLNVTASGGKPRHCKKHGGAARCQHEGCTTSASPDGKGGKPVPCVAHSGGARCQQQGCTTKAIGDGRGGKPMGEHPSNSNATPLLFSSTGKSHRM